MLVDDEILFAESLKMLLTSRYEDIEVVGTFYSGDNAIEHVAGLVPDVVLLDMRMPNSSGAKVCASLLEARPAMHVMILTTFDMDQYVVDAMQSGAEGYLLKDVDPSFLVDAIRSISRGGVLFSPRVARKLIGRLDTEPGQTVPDELDLLPDLSDREHQIVRLVAQGYSNKEIAAEACIAEQTVKNYLSAIYSRLGVHNRAHAILKLRENYENVMSDSPDTGTS